MSSKRKGKNGMVVPQPKLPKDRRLKFSFQYYDSDSDCYCLSLANQGQVKEVMKRLKEISSITFSELQQQRTVYHFHSVDWMQTAEKSGFPDSRLNEMEAFQFALLGVNGQKARVFGTYAEGTFYIVWFDLDHKIWPSFKKHT